MDLTTLQTHLRRHGKELCLPVLRPGKTNRLWFSPFGLGDRLRPNRFGILEPDTRRRPPLPLRVIDVVLMPLVGFDSALNRLGMGGGFYDRTLAPLRHGKWRKPRLIGVAHECQRIEVLERRPWDIPMDSVVTERGIYTRRQGILSPDLSENPGKR